ncbi:unnamed protein product [Phytophthora fragariaefolia]|uniref:Unnamed protein product n=1 Tax=Phytophthora fragariaefolia TaxID=1490495 RepID=A0A9W6Y932_9STRA|nr:unnamed protein product [Phytophthora fragariaefolia]
MVLVVLICALVGNAGVFGVKIDASARVWELKKAIWEEIKEKFIHDDKFRSVVASDLQLSLAKTADGKWLTQLDALQGVSDTSGYKHLQFTDAELRDVGLDSGDLGEVSRAEKAAGKGHVHVLVVVPKGAGGSVSEAPKIDQLIEKVDKVYEQTVLGKRKVYRHSSASSTLLTELNVRLQATRAFRFATGDLTHAAPFRWESISDERGQNIALTEEQQRERYRAYVEINIGDVLTRNRLCVYGVENGKDILKAEIPGHNIKLVGRTDMIILSDLVLENPLDLGILPDVRLLIEVKRKVKERDISQALSELIALDVLVDEPVMALLTDLTGHWQFFWVSDLTNNHGNIRSVTLRDPSEAFAVIRTLLNQSPTAGAEISLPCFQEPVKRQKLSRVVPSIAEASGSGIRECIERYYDIASMLGPDIEMARSVARQVTRSIPTLSYFS